MGHLYAELMDWARVFVTYCRMGCACLQISRAELKRHVFFFVVVALSLTWCAFPRSSKKERCVSKLKWPELTDGLNWRRKECKWKSANFLSLSKIFSAPTKITSGSESVAFCGPFNSLTTIIEGNSVVFQWLHCFQCSAFHLDLCRFIHKQFSYYYFCK